MRLWASGSVHQRVPRRSSSEGPNATHRPEAANVRARALTSPPPNHVLLRKGQLNRHTRYRPATTTRNTATAHAVVAPLGGLTHRRGFSRIRPPTPHPDHATSKRTPSRLRSHGRPPSTPSLWLASLRTTWYEDGWMTCVGSESRRQTSQAWTGRRDSRQ